MTALARERLTVDDLVARQCGVVARGQALQAGMTAAALDWLVQSGRWQRPYLRAYVSHSGSLTGLERAWAGWASAWPYGVLGCATAAWLGQLRDYESAIVHVITEPKHQLSRQELFVPHRARSVHAHPVLLPPRTRLPRSLVDMAGDVPDVDDAVAILAAGVQQRLVPARALYAEIAARPTYRWSSWTAGCTWTSRSGRPIWTGRTRSASPTDWCSGLRSGRCGPSRTTSPLERALHPTTTPIAGSK